MTAKRTVIQTIRWRPVTMVEGACAFVAARRCQQIHRLECYTGGVRPASRASAPYIRSSDLHKMSAHEGRHR
jgi:hypothetical protein